MEVKFCFLDADYYVDGDKPVVRLFGKTEDGKSICVKDRDFLPYFYVRPVQGREDRAAKGIKKAVEAEGLVTKSIEKVEMEFSGRKRTFLKVFCDIPPNVPKLRDVVKRFKKDQAGSVEDEHEYGISFYKRYIIDKELEPLGWYKVKGKKEEKGKGFDLVVEKEKMDKTEGSGDVLKPLAFDIESYENGGENRVIMVSFYEKEKKVITYGRDDYPDYVETLGSEKELLERFLEVVKEYDPDILLTYNGDAFDFQVLRDRFREYGMEMDLSRDGSEVEFIRRARSSSARIAGRTHIDLFNFVSNILPLQTEVLTLEAVAEELLGEKKIDMTFEEIMKSWRKEKNLSKLAEYCLKDSELTYNLGMYLLPQIYELSRISGQIPFDCSRMTYGQLVESYLIKKSKPGSVVPNRPKYDEIQKRRKEEPYQGAFVKEPVAGVHEDVTVLDFASLYPSIIVTFNISPETLSEEGYDVPGMERHFSKKKNGKTSFWGFIPSVIKGLIDSRADIKERMKKASPPEKRKLDNRQYALKILANAMYGYYGYPGARWYSRECAESITAFGRKWIKKAMEEAEKEGFNVIYGDTDSLMIKGRNPEKFLKKINKILPGIMKLDLEEKFKRGIFVSRSEGTGAKKRYALYKKSKLKIRGFEIVRRDWCELAKKTQRRVLMYILDKNDVRGAIDYVEDKIKKLRKGKMELKNLVIYTQLNKKLSEYKSTGPHVVAARKMKERGRPVGPGMVVMFIITKGEGSISERAEPFEDVKKEDVDVEYYINNQIIPSALRVLRVVGVDEDQLLGKGKQKSLKGF